ncbi:MAG TPA: hypothetical protein DCE47_00040 [Planctomycetaceae bacterium]|nr:hypothetical protein [Planctomycetaceae bacterium]|tara:strand:+ start:696 stop:3302 length:2607 start_codon:yes stop_codon:yes gene_type:complete
MKHLALYLCVFSAPLLLGQSSAAAEKSGPRFETEVRLILKAHCWQCHGEADEKKGGLDTRLARFLIKGGESGPAIVPGKHTDSRLFKRVASGEMPPGAKRLSARDVEVLARWIDAGARTVRPEPASLADGSFTVEERQHWSFRPIRRPPSPAVQHGQLLQSPIDAFLLAKLESRGQGFGPEADRPTLVRRLAFDLHGLPPGPGVVERFVSDRAPGAWSRLVDRLLASPAYGERWARHWLDVVGYADSDGVTQRDRPRNWSFKYRDYTIRALNADKPWNEFVVEQLAGDELVTPPHQDLSAEQAARLIATGFLRMAPDGTSGSGANQELASNQVVAEVIKVVSTSLLGLTVGCAQCHQHRYDPITHADYYRLRALFEPAYDPKHWRSPSGRLVSQWDKNVRETVAVIDKKLAEITSGKNAELEAAVKKAFETRLAKLPAEIRAEAKAARETAAAKRNAKQKQLIEDYPFLSISRGTIQQFERSIAAAIRKKWDDQSAAVGKQRPAADNLMCLSEVPGQVPPTRLFSRGDFKQPREEIKPGELSVLSPVGFSIPANDSKLPTTGRRLAYARYLTNGRHPLLARVLVNRFWMHHFGRGLVSTPGNFGAMGTRPTHPKLLDWLASEFMQSGWSLKHLHRVILTSTAYRQSATRREKLDQIDPDNQLLGRMSVRRLEAETLRDSLIHLGGRFSDRMFGPPVPVSLDSVGHRIIVSNNRYDPTGRLLTKIASIGSEEFRRTIYIQVRRSMPLGVLTPFDPPTMKPNCEVRTASTTAPQSLMMMNDPFVVRHVGELARRVRTEASDGPAAEFDLAWWLVFGRGPSDFEQRTGLKFLQDETAAVRAASPKDTDPALTALSHLCHALVSSNGFLYVD